jgi:hypothetical protein
MSPQALWSTFTTFLESINILSIIKETCWDENAFASCIVNSDSNVKNKENSNIKIITSFLHLRIHFSSSIVDQKTILIEKTFYCSDLVNINLTLLEKMVFMTTYMTTFLVIYTIGSHDYVVHKVMLFLPLVLSMTLVLSDIYN